MSGMTSGTLHATTAKLRAVYGKRLREEDYEALVTRKSVSEIAEYLKNATYYRDALANVDTGNIHRGYLELVLRRNLFETYERFCKFQQLDRREFFRFQLVYNEIRELLRGILYLNAGSGDDFIAATPAYLLSRASFPILELGKAKDFSAVLKLIGHTPYRQVLEHIPVSADGRVDYTQCELRLRTYYLKWLHDLVDRNFRGKNRTALLGQIDMQTDLINIINAYRMKTFFRTDGEDLKHRMLPFYGRLSEKRMQALYDAPDPDAFMQLLSDTIYGRQLPDRLGELTPAQLERALMRLRCDLARRSIRTSQNAAVSIYSMMYLLENELNNIIKVIEGVRYEKSVPYIQSLLVIS